LIPLPRLRPQLMGILNVTPDSFSDGGLHFDARTAVQAGRQMIDDGADMIDVGGESTRPGAEPVSVEEELRRVLPVVQALAEVGVTVSIDTMKADVARHALAAGAKMVNDITALRDPKMRKVCAQANCQVCLMHMSGEPKTMQADPHYNDVVEEVRHFLLEAAIRAENDGIHRDNIWLDPGIGFGKTAEHNLLLLKHLERIVDLGYPVMVGVSRKSFLGKIGREGASVLPPQERVSGTLAAQTLSQVKGARIIRAHDVKEARRAMDVIEAVMAAP